MSSVSPCVLQERSPLNARSKAAAGPSPPPTSARFTSGRTPASGRTTAPSPAAAAPSPAPPTTRTTCGYTPVGPGRPARSQPKDFRLSTFTDLWLVPAGEKPYVCTVPGCEKRFTEYSSLYKHHVVHTPCKPYNCNHCGKTYKQISTLAMHKRTTHNDTEPIEEEQEAYFEPPSGQCKTVQVGGVNGLCGGLGC